MVTSRWQIVGANPESFEYSYPRSQDAEYTVLGSQSHENQKRTTGTSQDDRSPASLSRFNQTIQS